MLLHDSLNDAHPQPDSLRFTIGEEGLEDTMANFFWNTAARVLELQNHVLEILLRADGE